MKKHNELLSDIKKHSINLKSNDINNILFNYRISDKEILDSLFDNYRDELSKLGSTISEIDSDLSLILTRNSDPYAFLNRLIKETDISINFSDIVSLINNHDINSDRVKNIFHLMIEKYIEQGKDLSVDSNFLPIKVLKMGDLDNVKFLLDLKDLNKDKKSISLFYSLLSDSMFKNEFKSSNFYFILNRSDNNNLFKLLLKYEPIKSNKTLQFLSKILIENGYNDLFDILYKNIDIDYYLQLSTLLNLNIDSEVNSELVLSNIKKILELTSNDSNYSVENFDNYINSLIDQIHREFYVLGSNHILNIYKTIIKDKRSLDAIKDKSSIITNKTLLNKKSEVLSLLLQYDEFLIALDQFNNPGLPGKSTLSFYKDEIDLGIDKITSDISNSKTDKDKFKSMQIYRLLVNLQKEIITYSSNLTKNR
jgi:hypothetical protein